VLYLGEASKAVDKRFPVSRLRYSVLHEGRHGNRQLNALEFVSGVAVILELGRELDMAREPMTINACNQRCEHTLTAGTRAYETIQVVVAGRQPK
jgi:hypothetical protein